MAITSNARPIKEKASKNSEAYFLKAAKNGLKQG
jgi:hypothetical protein